MAEFTLSIVNQYCSNFFGSISTQYSFSSQPEIFTSDTKGFASISSFISLANEYNSKLSYSPDIENIQTGVSSKEISLTAGSFASFGNLDFAKSTLSLKSLITSFESAFDKKRTIIEETELLLVEVIVSIHSTFHISFSSLEVTKSSTLSGLAPGRVVTTTAIQISTSGVDSKGKLFNPKNPVITTKAITSQVNLILSTKKLHQEVFNFSSNSKFSK
jgi:hypothetical protein